jgi:hypothetical protein
MRPGRQDKRSIEERQGSFTGLHACRRQSEGFTLLFNLDGLDSLPPALPGWQAELDGRRLVVRAADGLPALDTDGAPPGWVEAVLDQHVLITLVPAQRSCRHCSAKLPTDLPMLSEAATFLC